MNFKTISNFITEGEKEEILSYANNTPDQKDFFNKRIRKVAEKIKGWSTLYDFTKTEVSAVVSRLQGESTVVEESPEIYHQISDRIANALSISKEHVFFQYILVGAGGCVSSHYDVGMPGYITYKCNICIEGPEQDIIHIDKSQMNIKPMDLFCFEANLYRHWLDVQNVRRIQLSYGFLLPYQDLSWDENHPRIRMSNRVWNTFLSKIT